MTQLAVRQVSDPTELERVYRFRYRIYVEEMGRPQAYADHLKKRIEDTLDRTGYVFAAFEKSEVVGTVRTNFVRDNNIGEYDRLYALDSVPGDVKPFASLTTRLMVAPRYRARLLAVQLACAVYSFGLREGIHVDFIDCNQHLVPFFSRLGYLPFRTDVNHPEYGRVHVMQLNLLDFGAFKRLRSPFRRILSAAVPSVYY